MIYSLRHRISPVPRKIINIENRIGISGFVLSVYTIILKGELLCRTYMM